MPVTYTEISDAYISFLKEQYEIIINNQIVMGTPKIFINHNCELQSYNEPTKLEQEIRDLETMGYRY